MNFEKMKIKDKYIGKFIKKGDNLIELTEFLTPKEKSIIYNTISKNLFEEIKEEKEIKTITLDNVVKLPKNKKLKNNDK